MDPNRKYTIPSYLSIYLSRNSAILRITHHFFSIAQSLPNPQETISPPKLCHHHHHHAITKPGLQISACLHGFGFFVG
jgi:hypothetical protein